MKWSEFRRLAEQNGWILIHYGKKHDVYEKDGVQLHIERHASAEMKKGIYHKYLKIVMK